jgi:hypothetical protein
VLDNCVGVHVIGALGKERLDILGSLVHVAFNIHSVTRSLRDGETEVDRSGTRHASKTDKQTPHVIDGLEVVHGIVVEESTLVASNDNEANEGGEEVAPALEGKDSCRKWSVFVFVFFCGGFLAPTSHKTSTNTCARKLR